MMKPNRRRWANVAASFVILFLSVGGCSDGDSDDNAQANSVRHVAAVPTRKGPIAEALHLTGTLAAAQEVKVTSKIPGRVAKVLVEAGSSVKAGTVLIELEREELSLAVGEAEATVAAAEAGLARVLAGTRKEEIAQEEAAAAQAKANADVCRLTFERMANLLKEQSIPKTRYDEAKAQCDTASARYKAAQASLEMARKGPTKEDIAIARTRAGQARAALASVKKQYQNASIVSPINGIVAYRNVEPGEVVSPPVMPGKALLVVVDVSALKTKVNVSEKRVKAVSLGQEAGVTVDAFPGEIFHGKVSMISPVVDARNRTFEAEILIPNPAGRLKPGMFTRVQLVVARRTDVVKIPLKAVCEGNNHVVFVAANGTAEARQVTLGISDGVDVEVISGVTAGEMVITRGNLGLGDGERVVVKSEKTRK